METLDFEAFVPPLIRRRAALGAAPAKPVVERFEATLLLADLTGFTSLAEQLSGRGRRGAEDLKDVLNLFFGRLVDLVHGHGGQVLTFPGDAILALWRADEDERADSSAVRLAARCALEAQEAMTYTKWSDVRLQMRVGIGAGEVWVATLGGIGGRWEMLVAGTPLAQAAYSISLINPGEVAISSAVHQRLAPFASVANLTEKAFRLTSVAPPSTRPQVAPLALDSDSRARLRAYVPRFVQASLDAGQTDWLAEFRRVSVLFIKLRPLDVAVAETADELQRAVVTVQTVVYRYGGAINQLLADDKGIVVVCGWGFALHAHADDQVRAVRTALDLRRELGEIGMAASFGLATGDVFTGLRGNRQRCEHALIGDVVNIAARLMDSAGGEILCDLASCEGATQRIEFETLAPIRVKGREQPVDVYRPRQVSASRPSELVGRVRERRALRERIETLATSATGGVVILEGDAGIGKSRLVADVVERAVARGVRAIVAAGEEIERSTPYHPWRALFDNLLGADENGERAAFEERIFNLVKSQARLAPFAPLLNPVLRLNLPETEWSLRVPPRGRALLTRDLLVHLFRSTTGHRPTLLVLEDAHWFDSASWALAEGIARELPDMLLLIVTRSVTQTEKPPEFAKFSGRQDALVLRLEGLAPDETGALVRQRLRARALTEPVAKLIQEKAEGHPFFAEELAHALRDRGLVQVTAGVCRFTAAAERESVQLPNTVRVLVESRIDQLTVPQQLTIKVASVFGRTFDLASLRAVYPIALDERELEAHLQALVDRDHIHRSAPDAASTYAFKHAITQDVAYGLLTFALRRQLHRLVAAESERQHAADLADAYPLLAYHWTRAEDANRAIFYLERAGEKALARHASEEALRFFREAAAIDEKSVDPIEADEPVSLGWRTVSARNARRVRWYRRLGDASINLGRWDEGRAYFEQALSLVGRALPSSDRAWAVGLGTQLMVQCMRRLTPKPFRSQSPSPALLLEAVAAYGRIGASAYLYDRAIQVLYSLVAALNLAERLPPTPEFALVCADVGNVFGLAALRPLARVYHRIATETAARVDDPGVAIRIAARTAVYQLGIGNWDSCRHLDAAMLLCDQIGDSYVWEENAAIRARAAHLMGEFELAARLGTEIRGRARATGSLVHEIWGYGAEVWGVLYRGDLDLALELADRALELVATSAHTDRPSLLDFYGAKALAHLHRGDVEQAWSAAQRIRDMMANAPRPRYFALLYMSAVAEVCLARWEAKGTSNEAAEARNCLWRFCRAIEQYARVNLHARPRSFLVRGSGEWLDGRERAAHAAWRRALAEAERFSLPFEKARIHEEIGRHLATDDPCRHQHLARAVEDFHRLNAATDLKRAKARLDAGAAAASV